MSAMAEIIARLEASGVALHLAGDRVRLCYEKAELQNRLATEVDLLRAHRDEVAGFLRIRNALLAVHPRVKLVEWRPIDPPVAIESCAVVVDVQRFIKGTLSQLRLALADSKRRVGWTVPQLIDRLEQVGVIVDVDR